MTGPTRTLTIMQSGLGGKLHVVGSIPCAGRSKTVPKAGKSGKSAVPITSSSTILSGKFLQTQYLTELSQRLTRIEGNPPVKVSLTDFRDSREFLCNDGFSVITLGFDGRLYLARGTLSVNMEWAMPDTREFRKEIELVIAGMDG